MSKSSIGSADNEFDDSVSIAVVTAVATERGVSPTQLPPLYEWIDPDALDSLFRSTRRGGPRHGRLEFNYDGHAVIVESGDGLEITIDGASAAEPMAAPKVDSTRDSLTDA